MRSYLNTLIALLIALLLIIVLLVSLTEEPIKAILTLLSGPIDTLFAFGSLLSMSSILILCGLAMTFSFQAGSFNLGGEGQIYSAGLCAALIALYLPSSLGTVGIVLMLATGLVVGGFIGGISGWMKARWQTGELISSFLLSGALVFFVDYLIAGPLRDTTGFLQATQRIDENLWLPRILPPSDLTFAIFAALLIALLVHLFYYHSLTGYELRVFGQNPGFASFGGIDQGRMNLLSLSLSGGVYGLAGAMMVTATQHAAVAGFTRGYGWNGITVALIAHNRPLLVIPAALLLAWVESGTQAAMATSSLSYDLATLIRGIILLVVTLQAIRSRV